MNDSLAMLRKRKLITRMQQQYHRNHPWQLSPDGLHIPYSHHETPPDGPSWRGEADVGFILNGRRVIVRWRHPRQVYAYAIEIRALREAGPVPPNDLLTAWSAQGLFRRIHERLVTNGIELEVTPSWRLKQLRWETGVDLVAPLEVRGERELAEVAALARRLLVRETTLADVFPGACYTRADWLRDQAKLADQKAGAMSG